jgi:predicted DNA-binding WGR domain protein
MPDPASPIQHTLVLRRVDPEHGIARFYALMIKALMIERDLFGTIRLVRHWGRIGSRQGRELVQEFATEAEAAAALERIAAAKRRRGYQDL